MPRVDLPAVSLVPNGSIAQPAGVVGNTDGHRVVPNAAWPVKTLPENLTLRVTIATATTTVTVKAGAKPPALETQAVSVSLPVGTHVVGPFTSSRVVQADGTIHVDYSTAANVTAIAAIHHPDAT